MILFYFLVVLLLVCNTALLVALCGTMNKLLQTETAEPKRVLKGTFVSDEPVPRSPNYGDAIMSQRPSEDLILVRDQ